MDHFPSPGDLSASSSSSSSSPEVEVEIDGHRRRGKESEEEDEDDDANRKDHGYFEDDRHFPSAHPVDSSLEMTHHRLSIEMNVFDR